MANKADYIIALQEAIWQLHKCRSAHIGTAHVNEQFRGTTVWDGDVEVFKLHGHPKAYQAYAWARLEGKKDETTKFVTVLELPPVIDARTAVQASIKADGMNERYQLSNPQREGIKTVKKPKD